MTEPRRPDLLRRGDDVPEFAVSTDSGRTISRSDLLGHPTVLYFYPKAGSPGCSMESREFARHHSEFVAAGVRVIGVSVDPPDAQRTFREKCDLPFDLIADSGREMSARFGVLGVLGVARRTTFLLDADGRVVDVIRSWRPRLHTVVALQRLVGARRPTTPGRP